MTHFRTLVLVGCLSATAISFADFQLLAGETSAGATGPWRGIQRYNFVNNGAPATVLSGIAAANLSDPAGLAVSNTGELFVGNRHGNVGAASVNRFVLSAGNYVSSGPAITGNALQGTHGVAIRPGTGELFAGNVNGPVSRFLPSGGNYVANGTILVNAIRDVTFNQSGNMLYATRGVNANIIAHNMTTNVTTEVGIAVAGGLHQMAWRNNELYVTGFSSGTVARVNLDANGIPVSSTLVANVAAAIGIAFSPDGNEMFVSGHSTNLITRLGFDSGTSSWIQTGTIATGVNMGWLAVVPEPGTWALIAGGVALLAKRRRRA